MTTRVCGIGVASALGIGCNENLSALLAKRCGIIPASLQLRTNLAVPVGEIALSNDQIKQHLGIPPQQTHSRTALLGAIAAREAITMAAIPQGKRVGLISSTSVGGMDLSEHFYRHYLENHDSGRLRYVASHECAASTRFIATQCGITHYATTISTACSSAANAIIMGARMLEQGWLDYALVGGTDALCAFTLNGFNSLMILDRQLCRPLDTTRQGLNLGEGAGYIVLTRDDAPTLGYLAGYANANDAHHQTASSENGEGAYRAMSEALAMSRLAPDAIDYVNLHGTGTTNNDASELAALRRLFGDTLPASSSTKCYTGHTLAAAGGIEAVYSLLALQHNVKYAALRCDTPIDGITPLRDTERTAPVRNVLTNSFGFGGNCSSLIFSQP